MTVIGPKIYICMALFDHLEMGHNMEDLEKCTARLWSLLSGISSSFIAISTHCAHIMQWMTCSGQ